MVANIAKDIAKNIKTRQEKILLTALGLLLRRDHGELGKKAEECLLNNLLRQAVAMVDAEAGKDE